MGKGKQRRVYRAQRVREGGVPGGGGFRDKEQSPVSTAWAILDTSSAGKCLWGLAKWESLWAFPRCLWDAERVGVLLPWVGKVNGGEGGVLVVLRIRSTRLMGNELNNGC